MKAPHESQEGRGRMAFDPRKDELFEVVIADEELVRERLRGERRSSVILEPLFDLFQLV